MYASTLHVNSSLTAWLLPRKKSEDRQQDCVQLKESARDENGDHSCLE